MRYLILATLLSSCSSELMVIRHYWPCENPSYCISVSRWRNRCDVYLPKNAPQEDIDASYYYCEGLNR